MTCPILGCTIEATGLGLCRGHWRHVPRPIQSEIYQLVKRHKGGPSHQMALRRACIAVNNVLERWEKNRVASASEQPASMPYRDD